MLLIIYFAIFVILPFILGPLLAKNYQRDGLIMTIDAFVLMNIVINGIVFVVWPAIFNPHYIANQYQWAYSPLFVEYGMTVFAIAFICFISIFCKANFKMAAIFAYAIFVLGAAVSHLDELYSKHLPHTDRILTLICYDFLVGLILLCLVWALNDRIRQH